MNEQVEWLRAQLADDERVARAATRGPWRVAPEPPSHGDGATADVEADWTETRYLNPDPPYNGAPFEWRPNVIGDRESFGAASSEDACHIARHHPARVLHRIAVDRAIVDDCVAAIQAGEIQPGTTWNDDAAGAQVARIVLAHLTSVYADRPGCRAEWLPPTAPH